MSSIPPVSQADEDTINSYLPEPHVDGTPIDPSELPTSLSTYLIQVKPEKPIDGVSVAIGSPVSLGVTEDFTMTFSWPGINANDVIRNDMQALLYA